MDLPFMVSVPWCHRQSYHAHERLRMVVVLVAFQFFAIFNFSQFKVVWTKTPQRGRWRYIPSHRSSTTTNPIPFPPSHPLTQPFSHPFPFHIRNSRYRQFFMISTTWFLFSFWLKQFLGYDSTQLKFISDYFNQISGVLGYKIWVISFCSLEWSKEQAFLFIAWLISWEVVLHDKYFRPKIFNRQVRYSTPRNPAAALRSTPFTWQTYRLHITFTYLRHTPFNLRFMSFFLPLLFFILQH